jgi:hypothetical protein
MSLVFINAKILRILTKLIHFLRCNLLETSVIRLDER